MFSDLITDLVSRLGSHPLVGIVECVNERDKDFRILRAIVPVPECMNR